MASHHSSDRNRRPSPSGAQRTGPVGGVARPAAGAGHTAAESVQRPALTDQRFQDLLKDASRFFAQAEDDGTAAKQAAIADILALMARYQLTVEDLA